ncbi:penicillin-binding protein 2 [Candidatus Saccharibacteria bacterium]|nr:penicillin-binding protein 2 [Candidatus Saccharibacteria bacterium]
MDKSIERRVKFLAIATGIALIAIAGRLFGMQVINHEQFVIAAEQNQTRQWTLHAARGTIYWRDGNVNVPAVLNEQVYLVFVDFAMVENRAETRAVIERTIQAGARFDEAMDARRSRYVILARNVPRAIAEEIRSGGVTGIGFEEGTRRVYPEGTLGSRILGFVNHEGVGLYGVEGAFNNQLTGTDGTRRAITDLRNVPLTVATDQILIPPEDGQPVRLTIDRNIQVMAEGAARRWAAYHSAEFVDIIVKRASNGEVLAMASRDGFDPANFQRYDTSRFTNPVLIDAYEPASVMKTPTFAAALSLGVLRPTDTFINHRQQTIDGMLVRNADDRHSGAVQTFQEAMDWSFNTGSVEMLRRMGGGELNQTGRQHLYDMFSRLGFGRRTGIELPESAGFVSRPESAARFAINHCFANMTFGQCTSMSMLQIANAYSAMVNGGTLFRPTIIQGQGGEVLDQNIVTDTISRELRESLHTSFNLFQAARRPPFTEMYCGGKTGTAQVVNPAGGYFDDRLTGSFFGFCVEEEGMMPDLIVGVRYGGPGLLGSGSGAKMIWRDLLAELMPYWRGVVY